MKSLRHSLKIFFAAAVLLSVAAPSPLFACATCFGKSDSALAQGMNWGIFTLLGFILTVLTCVAALFRSHHPQGRNADGQSSAQDSRDSA